MIATPRLVLRAWHPEDAAAHHAMCNDPRVSASLGARPSMQDSRSVVVGQNTLLASHGYCFWAMQTSDDGRLAGWCGIKPGKPPIEGEVEIGWGLRPDLCGRGLGHEAAAAVLAWTWANTGLPAIVAITAAINVRSAALMQRLGMVRQPDEDFDHPDLTVGDPLRRHILCRIDRPAR